MACSCEIDVALVTETSSENFYFPNVAHEFSFLNYLKELSCFF